MRENGSFSKVLSLTALVWLVTLGIPVFFLLARGSSIWWVVAGLVVAVIFSSAVLPPYFVTSATRDKAPNHERIHAVRTWHSPLLPDETLGRVRNAFQKKGSVVRSNENSIEISFGSDLAFRKWGIFTEQGRQALPMHLSVRVISAGAGSQVTAEARDDLGWYIGPLGRRVRAEVTNLNHSLLETALDATRGSSQPSH